jgi:cytochrome c peroxidase
MEGDNNALNATERQGLSLFLHEGKCVNCHGGPEFTNAAFSHIVTSDKKFKLIERMLMGDKNPAIYDNGFYNINVRPTAEDVGVGGTDPFGNPLSFSVQAVTGPVVDKGDLTDSSDFEIDPGTPPQPGERVAVRGAFKTPTLRNIDLTGPYFHNGGQLTLEQVIQFYARGSDFKRQQRTDSDPDIRVLPKLNGNRTNIRALAAFLRTLTDPRVAFERAPFDHPSLPIPNGHSGSTTVVTEDTRLLGSARSGFIILPVVGAQGRSTPIQPVLGGSQVNSRGIPQSDGLPATLP